MLTKTLVKTMVQKMNQESEGHEEKEKDEEDEVEPQEDEEPRGGGLTDAEEQAGEDLKLDDYDPNPAPLEPPTSDELQQYMTSRSFALRYQCTPKRPRRSQELRWKWC